MIVEFDEMRFARDGYDLAIVGGGAAGISLAVALADSGMTIALLEAGGLDVPDQDEADPYTGSVSETDYPLATTRLRYFGGTTNHWGGWCRPLDPIDLESRPGRTNCGWPIEFGELANHYPFAATMCKIENQFGLDVVPESAVMDPPAPFTNKLFRFSRPVRFGTEYHETLADQENVDVVLEAPMLGFSMANGRVSGVECVDRAGRSRTVKADKVVIAKGGLENARTLLLAGDAGSVIPASDAIGRHFMDHFGFRFAHLLGRNSLQYFRFMPPGVDPIMPVLSMSADGLREHRLPNFSIQTIPSRPDSLVPPQLLANPGFSELKLPASQYVLQLTIEPRPDPRSRVTLSDARDTHGQRRLHLDWQIDPTDFDDIRTISTFLTQALGQAGLGRMKPDFDPGRARRPSVQAHHMGTTRMGVDPADSVVNPDLLVHGTENLFMLGSSVFPNGGFANPTLTVCALAGRLAHHFESGE